jgi:RimJ/RimL family protein N-acetyltransferase
MTTRVSEHQSLAAILEEVPILDDLNLRPWHSKDVPELVAAWADPAIAQWNRIPPEPTTLTATDWISKAAEQTGRSQSIDVVVSNGDSVLIGEIGLLVDHDRSIAEVGFWIAAEHRGAGLSLTLLRLAEDLISRLGIERAVAVVDPANTTSIAALQRARWPEVATTSNKRAFTPARR